MIDRRIVSFLALFFAAVLCFGQSNTMQSGQTAGSSTAPAQSTTGLTPPIQPKTPTVQLPPAVELPGVATPGVPNTPLTADEAAQIALHNQPNILLAKGQVAAAHGLVTQTSAALYPQLNVNQTYSRTDTFTKPQSQPAKSSAAAGIGPQQATTTGTTATTGATASTTGTTAGTTGTTASTTGTAASTTGTTASTTGTTASTTGVTTGSTAGTTGTSGSTAGSTAGTAGTSSGVVSGVFVKPQGWSGGATLTQLLFDFNHTRDLVREFEAQERVAKYEYSRAQLDTILSVKQAFYAFVQDQGLVDVQNAAYQAAQASLNQAQASLNAGLGAPADVVNAKTNLANTAQNLVQARQTALSARQNLCLQMGVDPRTPIVSAQSSEPEEPSDDLSALVIQAVKNRPEVLEAKESLLAATYGVSAARSSSAPQLNFTASYVNSGARNPLALEDLSGGINFTWFLEDGGLTRGRIQSAEGQVDIAKAQLQGATLNVIDDVSQAFVAVKTAEQRVTIADTQVQNATYNLKLAQGQYAAGVTEFVTVITAQAQLVQAQSDQVNATAALSEARATLAHALGK